MLKNKGFTLVEVAIVLLIGGILLASASALLLTYMKKTQINVTERRLESIDEALQLFLNLNGRYPCAARLNDLLDSATFGVEITNLDPNFDCTAAAQVAGETTQVAGRGGRTVRVGAVPVRTLNLPDEYIGDAWHGRFTYAITEALASPGTYNRNEGAIFVNDSNGNPVITFPATGTGHYVVVSHGQNNSGSTVVSGGGVVPCNAATLEGENCNNDATFVNTLLLGTNTANAATLNDDLITVRSVTAFGNQIPPGAVMPFNLFACPAGWVPFAGAGASIIIGADGGTTYNVGDTGGTDTVALTIAETGFSPFPNAVDLTGLPAGLTSVVENLGIPAAAHENLPPYIALLYCEKS